MPSHPSATRFFRSSPTASLARLSGELADWERHGLTVGVLVVHLLIGLAWATHTPASVALHEPSSPGLEATFLTLVPTVTDRPALKPAPVTSVETRPKPVERTRTPVAAQPRQVTTTPTATSSWAVPDLPAAAVTDKVAVEIDKAPSPPVTVAAAAEPALAQAPARPATPPPPSAAAPTTIPTSSVEYLVPPQPDYPRLSRREGEHGRVVLRVLIDTAGLPTQVQVNKSSGFVRLDDAARAALQRARFKPYTEHGQPRAGWTLVPIDFELEK